MSKKATRKSQMYPFSIYWKKRIFGHPEAVGISRDAGLIAACSQWSRVRVFDRAGHRRWNKPVGSGNTRISVSSDGSLVVVGSDKGILSGFKQKDMGSSRYIPWIQNLGSEIRTIEISAKGDLVAAGSKNGVIHTFDGRGSSLWSYRAKGWIFRIGMSDDGELICAGCGEGRLLVFNKEGQLLWQYNTGHEVMEASVTGNGSLIVAGSSEGRIYAFDKTGNQLWDFDINKGLTNVTISRNGSSIAVASHGKLYLFDSKGNLLWERDAGPTATGISMSGDGYVIAAGQFYYGLIVFDRKGKLLLNYGHEDEDRFRGTGVFGVGISQEGSIVAAGFPDGWLRVFRR